MARSAAGCRAPARGGVACPRGGGGRGGAALEPGDRSAGTLATVALAGIRPLGSARRGAAVAGAGARRLRTRSAMARRARSEEHTSELQSLAYLVCRLLLEKKK